MSKRKSAPDTKYINAGNTEFGPGYIGSLDGNPVEAAKAADGQLQVKSGDYVDFLASKPSQFNDGVYYVGSFTKGGQRYFISEGTNSRGAYLKLRPAKDNPEFANNTAGTVTGYGKRA